MLENDDDDDDDGESIRGKVEQREKRGKLSVTAYNYFIIYAYKGSLP